MTVVPHLQAPQAIAWQMPAGDALLGRGWQRAIERAQGAAWFQGPLATAGSTGARAGEGRPRAMAVAHGMAIDASSPWMARLGTAGSSDASVPHAAPAATGIAESNGVAIAASPAPSEGPGSAHAADGQGLPGGCPIARLACPRPDAGALPAQARARLAEPDPASDRSTQVHVHVERQSDGLHVWVGAPAASAAALARQLACPSAHRLPVRLASVVCNGMPLQSTGAQPAVFSLPGSAGPNQEP